MNIKNIILAAVLVMGMKLLFVDASYARRVKAYRESVVGILPLVHISQKDAAEAFSIIEEVRKTTQEQGLKFVVLLEYGPIFLTKNYIAEKLATTGMAIEELSKVIFSDENIQYELRPFFESREAEIQVAVSRFREGIPLFTQHPFLLKLGEYFADSKIETIIEDMDFDAWILFNKGIFALYLMKEAALRGDLDRVFRYGNEFWQDFLEGDRIKYRSLNKQISNLKDSGTFVLVIAGATHIQGLLNNISGVNIVSQTQNITFSPVEEIISRSEAGEILDSEEIKVLLLKEVVYRLVVSLPKNNVTASQYSSRELCDIEMNVVNRWDNLAITKLAEKLRVDKQQGLLFFYDWLKKYGTETEQSLFL